MTDRYDLDSVERQVDRDLKRHMTRLRRLLMQPSSSQEDVGIEDCADLVAALYRQVGCEKVEIVETKGNPVVYGECKGMSDKTLMGYFMYDTMPYNEPGWDHPPMKAKTVDMRLPAGKVKAIVNRGADNTKGPMAAFLNSLGACNKSVGRPPVGIILVAEGPACLCQEGQEASLEGGRMLLPLLRAGLRRWLEPLLGR